MSLSAAKAVLIRYLPWCLNPQVPSANPANSELNRWARQILVFVSSIFVVSIIIPTLARGEILIEPQVGFHGVFQLGRPFPLEIALNNTGRPAEGILEVRVWKGGATKGGAPYRVNYRREVFLAAQARKNIQLTVDPDFVSRSVAKPISFAFTGRTAVRSPSAAWGFASGPL